MKSEQILVGRRVLDRTIRAICQRDRLHLLLIILIFTALSFVLFESYLSGTLPQGSDSMDAPSDIQMSKDYNTYYSTWKSYSSIGYLQYPSPTVDTVYLLLSSVFGMSSLILAKSIMVVSFWFAGVAMYYCAKAISNSFVGAGIAAFVFALNQAFLSQVTEGHYFFVVSYAVFPLLFLLFYKMLNGSKSKLVAFTPLLFLIFGTFAPPNIILLVSIFLIIFTASRLLLKTTNRWSLVYLSVVLLALLTPILLDMIVGGGSSSLNAHYGLYDLSRYSSQSLLDAFTLKAAENSFFFGTSEGNWLISGIPAILAEGLMFAIPLLAFSSLMFKDRIVVIPLAIVSICFIFLAAGPNQPLGSVFVWLYTNVPMMDTMRAYSRCGLFIAFAYGLMISQFLANLKESNVRIRWPSKRIIRSGLCTLVVLALVVPSSQVFNGAVGSFELSPAYTDPFDWLSAQEGDFRVLNLPYQALYYPASRPRVDGYPSTTTLDTGTYGILYTHHEIAYGIYSHHLWSAIGVAIEDRAFGYRNLSILLGEVAGVKYILSQVHTDPEELSAFTNLTGLKPVVEFKDGSVILSNPFWKPKVHAFTSLSVLTGARSVLTTALGMKAINLDDQGVALLSQSPSYFERKQLLNISSNLIMENADFFEFAVEATMLGRDNIISLANYSDRFGWEPLSQWVREDSSVSKVFSDGSVAYTTGHNTLTVPVKIAKSGTYDIFLQLVSGQGTGNISVMANGQEIYRGRPQSTVDRSMWLDMGEVNLSSGTIQFLISNDGSGWNTINKLLVIDNSTLEERLEEASEMVGAIRTTYVVDGLRFMTNISSDWSIVEGNEGMGIAFIGSGNAPMLERTFFFPSTTNYSLSLKTMEIDQAAPTNGSVKVVIDGVEVPVHQLDKTVWEVDLGILEKGSHTIGLTTTSLYGLSINTLSSVEGGTVDKGDTYVSYEKVGNTRYVVTVNSTEPVFLELSENYHCLWGATLGDDILFHYTSGSEVNGYYIGGSGNRTVTINLKSQDYYPVMVLFMVMTALIGSAAIWYLSGIRSVLLSDMNAQPREERKHGGRH